MQLYIDTKNTTVEVRNACFLIKKGEVKRIINPKRIESIGVLSSIFINSSAIKLAAKNEIPIYFYNTYGKVEAELSNPDYLKHGKLRHKQLLFVNSIEGKKWVINQLLLKTTLQIQTIKRYKKETILTKLQKEELIEIIKNINVLVAKIKTLKLDKETFRNTLMAYEGNIAKLYFKALNYFLPIEFKFNKRTRRPAKDQFNAAINYLYGITYGRVSMAVKAAGLDVYVGVLHTTNYKESMVFDCIESIRPLIDRLLINLFRDNQLTQKHFSSKGNEFLINKEGKKVILPSYAAYLNKKLKVNNRILSLKNHIFWQSRDLKQLIKNYDLSNTI